MLTNKQLNYHKNVSSIRDDYMQEEDDEDMWF